MKLVTLRELKTDLGPVAAPKRFHAQLEKRLQKTTKTGNPYFEVGFADSEEKLLLRVWNNQPMFATCPQLVERDFYEIGGEFLLGNDGRSVDTSGWTARALDADEAANVLAGTASLREKQDRDYADIVAFVESLRDPRLRDLCGAFLAQFGERFRRTAAARDYHHARRGGLVEHVSQMMRSASKICEAYTMLNRDLLIAGVLFHDIGKLWENCYGDKGFTMPYTEISELISHIPLGMEIVNKLWRDLLEDETRRAEWARLEDPPSDRVRLHLLHLVASHHGELEFGAPVVPKTPEAQALHYIDNLDAKMEMFERGYLVAGELARNVYDRVRPLPGRLIQPLGSFTAMDPSQSPAIGPADEAEAEPELEPVAQAPAEEADSPGAPPAGTPPSGSIRETAAAEAAGAGAEAASFADLEDPF